MANLWIQKKNNSNMKKRMANLWIRDKKKQLRQTCLYQEKHSLTCDFEKKIYKKKEWLTCESRKKITNSLFISRKTFTHNTKEWLTCESRKKTT